MNFQRLAKGRYAAIINGETVARIYQDKTREYYTGYSADGCGRAMSRVANDWVVVTPETKCAGLGSYRQAKQVVRDIWGAK